MKKNVARFPRQRRAKKCTKTFFFARHDLFRGSFFSGWTGLLSKNGFVGIPIELIKSLFLWGVVTFFPQVSMGLESQFDKVLTEFVQSGEVSARPGYHEAAGVLLESWRAMLQSVLTDPSSSQESVNAHAADALVAWNERVKEQMKYDEGRRFLKVGVLN